MSRMIDANALKAGFEEDGHLSPYIEEFIDACPTVGGWISVEDRLPEIGEAVLVICRFGKMIVSELDGYWGKERLFWTYPNWVEEQIEVTHWMPLPEPPKEEEK